MQKPHKPLIKQPQIQIPLKSKPKLFVFSDAPCVNTGFGKVIKNLLRDAHEKFEVRILGINYSGMTRYDSDKWFIYTAGGAEDPFGYNRMPFILQEFKPDLIFLFQDIFNIEKALPIIRKSYNPECPIVVYFPVDGVPFSPLWTRTFGQSSFEGIFGDKKYLFGTNKADVSKIITFSQFAVDQIHKSLPVSIDREDIEILYHGVETNDFKLLDEAERLKIKKELGWEDKFVAINVNRFQPRKQFIISLRVMALLTYGYKKCSCGNYYRLNLDRCDLNNCGPEEIVDIVTPKEDIAYYIHGNRGEIVMGPLDDGTGRLESHALNAGYPGDSLNKNLFLVNRNLIAQPFTEEELNRFYNAADVNITTTIGEGCGLSLLEASASGTTSIASNNSAVPEQLRGTGRLIPNAGLFNLQYDAGHIRQIVSVPRFVDALEEEYKAWVDNGRKKVINKEAIKNIKENFLWGDKRERLMKIFEEALNQE